MAKQTNQSKQHEVDVKVHNFCGKAKIFFLITLALVVISLLSTFTGVDVALEFKGGTIITYSYTGDIDERTIESELSSLIGSSVTAQVGDSLNSDAKTLSLSFSSNEGLTIERQAEVSGNIQEILNMSDSSHKLCVHLSRAQARKSFAFANSII